MSVDVQGWTYLSCNSDCNSWIRSQYARYEHCVRYHHWKILVAGLAFLGLCWLGFKSADFERDLIRLWIYNSTRLHNEMSYVVEHSSNRIDQDSIETVLQITNGNILSPQFLLEHLQLLTLITNLELRFDARVFTLSDLCRQIQLPGIQYIDEHTRANIESIMPCQIVSPLNCFWEGSKLFNNAKHISSSDGDNDRAIPIDWRTFDSKLFLNSFKESWYGAFFVKLFNETGINRGYLSNPCIDVTDPLCPNKSRKTLNFEIELEKGCYQVAQNLYNYPKEVLVGEHHRAIQSLIFLRSPAEVFQALRNSEDWSEDKVRKVILLWQRKMREMVIKYNKERPYLESVVYKSISFQSKRVHKSSFYTFTNNSLPLALEETYADDSVMTKYLLCTGLLILFVLLTFMSSDNPVRSHCWLAITGILLLITAMVAGLGLSAAIGFKFTVLTTQVIPFIMLGLGVEEVIVLTSSYSRNMDRYTTSQDCVMVHPVYQTLHNCATVLLLSFLVKMSIIGGIISVPVPLMRHFCGEILLITIFQTGAAVFLYPCLLYLDSMRQLDNRVDILCCLVRHTEVDETEHQQLPSPPLLPHSSAPLPPPSQIVFSTEFTTSATDMVPNNVRQYVEINPLVTSSQQPYKHHQRQASMPLATKPSVQRRYQCCWKTRYRISKMFMHAMALVPVHITVILLAIVIVILGVYSTMNMHCGLKAESIFRQDSNEYNYVKYESSEFRLNNFDILTQEIDYPRMQEVVLLLNEEVKGVPEVQVFGNGKFWLSSFILWLERLQSDLDDDLRRKSILPNGTWRANASVNGLLAMTLLVQDRGAINYRKLRTTKLVHSHRVNEANFYLYLNAWRSMSSDYDTIPCILYPQFPSVDMRTFIPDTERREPSVIRMSGKHLYRNNPLQFVTCKYFHRGVKDKEELSLVKTIRSITSRFTERGVSSLPLGIVFSLSEQYISLRYHLMIAAVIALVAVFFVALLTMNNLLATVLICLLLSSSFLPPFYFISVYHLPLNGTSGVMALWSGGLGIRFSLLVIVSYSEHSGSESDDLAENVADGAFLPNQSTESQVQMRMRLAISTSPCGPVLVSSLLSCAFISTSYITYIWEHFLLLPLVGITQSIFNCYLLTPVLCFYLLPKSPIMSSVIEHSVPTLPRTTSTSRSHSESRPKKSRSNPSRYKLSTIPEESNSIKSSTKSDTPPENLQSQTSSSSQEHPWYIEQNVQSSLTVQYPHSGPSTGSEIALKTSFKYRNPVNSGT